MPAYLGLYEQRPRTLFPTRRSLEVRFARGLTLQRGAWGHPMAAVRGGDGRGWMREARATCAGELRWLTPLWDALPTSGNVLQQLPPVMTPEWISGGSRALGFRAAA